MQWKFAWLTSEETFFKLLHQPKTWGGWVAPVWQLCLLDTYWDSMKQGVLSTTDLACVNHLFAGPQAIKGREEFKIPIRSHRMWCKALKATKTQPWLSRVPRDFSPTWAIMPFSCQKNGLAKLHDEIARIHENAGTVTHSPALRCSAHVSTCGTSNCLKTLSWLVNYSSQSNHQLLTLKYTWFPMNPQITWRNASILHLSNKKSEDFFPHSFPVCVLQVTDGLSCHGAVHLETLADHRGGDQPRLHMRPRPGTVWWALGSLGTLKAPPWESPSTSCRRLPGWIGVCKFHGAKCFRKAQKALSNITRLASFSLTWNPNSMITIVNLIGFLHFRFQSMASHPRCMATRTTQKSIQDHSECYSINVITPTTE